MSAVADAVPDPSRPVRAAATDHGDGVDRAAEWQRLREQHLETGPGRRRSSARGLHHVALLCRAPTVSAWS